jgi:DNA ligase (NAD+)
VREEGEAKWFCPNSSGCPTQIKGRLEHFVSRKAMNILCGEATIEQLYSHGLLRKPSDFYSLRKDQLYRLEGWKDRSAERFLESVAASRNVPFQRVLFAIGIRFVGETTARDIARHFGSMEVLQNATEEELLSVPEVGDVVAKSIRDFFANPDNIAEIQALRAAGLRFSMEEPAQKASDSLAGKSIVISGNFSISRDDMKALIEANGGRNSSSVSGKTDYLLAGEKPGPEKIRKATELGISIIDEGTFMTIISQRAVPSPEDIEPTLF